MIQQKTVREHLDWLYNKYGPFQVQTGEEKDKERSFSKRWDWLEAREVPWLVPKLRHRTILDIEIVLDYDLPKSLSEPEKIIKRMEFTKAIRASGLNCRIFYQGNYHVHLLYPELRFKTEIERYNIKCNIISRFGCDLQLAGKTNVALEYAPHWKRNIQKILVWERPGYNRLTEKDKIRW